MRTTKQGKPVVLVVSKDSGFCDSIITSFTKTENLVKITPTLEEFVFEAHEHEVDELIICVDSYQTEFSAVLVYCNSLSHRSMKYVFVPDLVDEETHNWAVRIHKSFGVFTKDAIDLDIFARDANETPVWALLTALSKDPLTGLENAQGFFNSVKPELAAMRNRRHNSNRKTDRRKTHMDHAAVLVIDANRIKLINDVLGHFSGDDAIVKIAGVLQKYVRNHVSRRSGDEFWIFLPGFTLRQAMRRGVVIMSAIASIDFTGKNGEPWPLSAFFGAASVHTGEIGEDVDMELRRLIEKADQELLKVKEDRNRKEGKGPGER